MATSPSFKSIGVLGGMGPEATAEFYLRLIRIFQNKFGCVNDYDYPDIYIYNLPLPEIVKSVDEKNVLASLQKGVDKLQLIGSDFIVCPCNSANTFFQRLKFSVPALNIFDETAKRIYSKKAGILGTRQTISSGEFQKRLGAFSVPAEDGLSEITKIIMNVLAGQKNENDAATLRKISEKFSEEGCDSIILGCTELPLLVSAKDFALKTYDTLQILAEAVADFSAGRYKNYIKKAA